MGIANPVTIGQNVPTAPSTSATVAFTSSAAVVIGGKIFVFVGWFGISITLSSVAGGSLTWSIVLQQVTAQNDHFAIVVADATNGLATSTAITATFSTNQADSRYICGYYITGAQAGVPATTNNGVGTTATAWSAGSISTPGYWALVGGAYLETTGNATNTTSGGNTEVHDFKVNGDSAMTTCYQIPNSSSSIASSGTWSGAGISWVACDCLVPLREPHNTSVNFQNPALLMEGMEKRNHLWLPKRKLWRPRIEIPQPVFA